MSPHVGNFVHDLVEMAKAMERVPGLESEIARLQGMVDNYAQQVQAIELRAIDRNTEIEQLNAKIRSLEVERDDASFRVMEAEDREHSLLSMAKAAAANLEQMTKLLDPPKPEPEVVSTTPDSLPDVTAAPSHLGAQEETHKPVWHGDLPIDPHQTEAPVSVSTDPIASTTEQNESPPVPTVGNTDTAPTTTSLDLEPQRAEAMANAFLTNTDHEPTERWTPEWYAWKDRQVAKPFYAQG